MAHDVAELLRRRKYPQALERMVDLYGKKVLGMAMAMLGERASAEETAQDIFLKVWQALPDWDGRAAPSTWLYTIARNTCLSAIRAAALRRTLPIEEATEPGTRETISSTVEVNQLLLRLPETQRQVVVLFYLQERSVEDVAQLLGLPEGTVKSHLHRARRALGGMMEEYTNGLLRSAGTDSGVI